MVSGTRCPYVSVCGCEMVSGAAAPMLILFDPGGWDLILEAGIRAWRLGLEPGGWDLSLKAGI